MSSCLHVVVYINTKILVKDFQKVINIYIIRKCVTARRTNCNVAFKLIKEWTLNTKKEVKKKPN